MSVQDAFDSLAAALLQVAQVRYEAFRERFGRDPEPNEPLLFDPTKDEPTAANWADRQMQVLTAAVASNVDAILVLQYLGFHHQIH
ncbi:MAG TPA: hypothetical protein VJ718_09045 [Candidatus Binataceae bacterium]|nr:hypothetical protein [Candidatus Binataceae bacterium]